MSDWQPIETAPKDGTDFLAWLMGNTHMVIYFDASIDSLYPWRATDSNSCYHVDAPTHWMPLPEPPSTEPVSTP